MRAATRWLADLRWTPHAKAFAKLDARSRVKNSDKIPFAQAYPDEKVIERWFEALFVDSALACKLDAAPRLRREHAFALLVQTRRGWGWDRDTREDMRARAALAAALAGDWDLVAEALGGRPLTGSVGKSGKFSSLPGLVRRVATAAKNALGEGSCAESLRGYAATKGCDLPTLWALARLAIELAGGHPRAEVPERFAAILAGAKPEPRAKLPAVDDPRVNVFERYMHLGSPEERAEVESWLAFVRDTQSAVWDSHISDSIAHASVLGMDDAVARLVPRLAELRPKSTSYPTPGLVFLAMLGVPADDWEAKMRADLKPFHRAREISTLRRYRWSTAAAAVALAAGDTTLVKKLTPASGSFRPGKTFGDDPRAVLRHYALALEAKATLADVTPAWVELLVTRAPDRDASRTGGRWAWDSLWCLAFAHFHRLGGAPPAEVPRLLRRMLRGEL